MVGGRATEEEQAETRGVRTPATQPIQQRHTALSVNTHQHGQQTRSNIDSYRLGDRFHVVVILCHILGLELRGECNRAAARTQIFSPFFSRLVASRLAWSPPVAWLCEIKKWYSFSAGSG